MSSNVMVGFRPAQVIRRLPWQFDRKTALGLLLVLAAFSLVAWLYLSQASAMTTTAYRIDELRLEIDRLENQNAALALEIAQLEALPRVQARAKELGFQPVSQVRYLPVANYPAQSVAGNTGIHPAYMAATPIGDYSGDIGDGNTSWWVAALDRFAAWLAGSSSGV